MQSIKSLFLGYRRIYTLMLNNQKLVGLKGKDKPYKIADIDGLYVVVSPKSTKSWRFNYSLDGKYKTKTYGQYPEISLSQARTLHEAFKLLLRNGMQSSSILFKDLVADWLKVKLPSLSNTKNKLNTISKLDRLVLPKLGNKPIDSIKRVQLVEVVKDIEALGIVESAHRVCSLLRQILDYAVDCGKIETHAANGLTRVLRPPIVNHIISIPQDEAGLLFLAISTYNEPITKIGLMLLAHTFVRTSELRYMQRAEIVDKFWIIPKERMKMNKTHVVPLSNQVINLLKDLDKYNSDSELILESPDRPGHPLSENTFLFALYRLGYRGKMTGHGFRSLASTVLNQHSTFSKDAIERQLAHKESDDVRAAYNRAEYLDERTKLMQWWSDWIVSQTDQQEYAK